MDPNCHPGPPPRAKIPKEGTGPRGAPECYYVSRSLDSTFRYMRFVKKLREQEEEQRLGKETRNKNDNDQQYNDFFSRCDRRALVNKVAHRVELCLEAYEEDLKAKRKRLLDLLTNEEEMNLHKIMKQTQEGADSIWQEKKNRLAYLLAKRQKETEEKYKDTPLSKCSHITPCLTKHLAKEAQECQLYQIREKQMRKMAEAEMEKMWHEVAMKEADALAARMEYDAIEQYRRNKECKEYTDLQLEQLRAKRAKEKADLRQQALLRSSMQDEGSLQLAEEAKKREEKRVITAQVKEDALRDREETVAKLAAEAKLVADSWDTLKGQSLVADQAEVDRIRQKEMEQDICNRRLADMKHRIAQVKLNNIPLILQEGQRIRDDADLKRCQHRKMMKQKHLDVVAYQLKQSEERKKEQAAFDYDAKEYARQVANQLDALVKHKELTDAQAKKLYQNDLREQIAYNNLLKDRALQEEMEQNKKCQLAAKEYEDQIKNMLNRPFSSEAVHPFMRQMSQGLQLAKNKCPCNKPTYCNDSTAETSK